MIGTLVAETGLRFNIDHITLADAKLTFHASTWAHGGIGLREGPQIVVLEGRDGVEICRYWTTIDAKSAQPPPPGSQMYFDLPTAIQGSAP